jgi:two-component system cell cycle sensor histidine kinase/response regulator CckA
MHDGQPNETVLRLRAQRHELQQKLQAVEQERNALRDSLHEYRILFRSAGTAMLVIEANGVISLINQEFERMAGVDRAEVEGIKEWTDFVAPADLSRLRALRERRLRGDPTVPADYDATFIGKSGAEITGHVSIVLVPGTERSIASIADITYRRHIEAQLAESERNYRTIFEESPNGIVILGPKGEVRNVNGRLHDWLGYSRDEVIGKNFLTLPFLPWRSKLRAMRKLTQRMLGRDLPPYEVLFVGKDGKPYYGRVRASLIRNNKGRPIADLVMISNITDQKRTERALQEIEQKLIKAQEIAHLGYWEYDVEHDHFTWSAELYRIYGVESDNLELNYATLRERILPEDRPYHEALVERLKTEGKADFEYRIRRPDGVVRYVGGKGEVDYDKEGTPTRLYGIVQDITDRRKNEEDRLKLEANLMQAQKLESLGVLASGIAHDFNNLLTAIIGNTELVRGELPADAKTHEGLAEIKTLARDAADLCRQMLAYSGQGQFYVHPLNVTEIIESMAHLLNVSIDKSIVLQSDLNPDIPAIEADASQIRQLVINLVSNASEAIGEQNGTIVLKTGHHHVSHAELKALGAGEDLQEGEYVFIIVEDDGEGIADDVKQRMFDPFFSTRFIGRGLGLAAVMGIVRGHNGAIHVDTSPGKGTRITVHFPASDAAVIPEGATPPQDRRPAQEVSPMS